MFLTERKRERESVCVVYFEQQTAASDAVCWSKSSFSAFLTTFSFQKKKKHAKTYKNTPKC